MSLVELSSLKGLVSSLCGRVSVHFTQQARMWMEWNSLYTGGGSHPHLTFILILSTVLLVCLHRPAGNLIATSQRLSHRHDIVFFEPNGLQHGQFTLPFSTLEMKVSGWLHDCHMTVT